jgi:DNA-binding NarL/FixJ family response regulator
MRVVIIGNDQLTRDALTTLLNYLGGFKVVASEDASGDPVNAIRNNSPDVVVVEARALPKEDIFELKRITDCKMVIIRDTSIRGTIYDAEGVVNPHEGASALFRAIRNATGMTEPIGPRGVREITSVYGPPAGLSRRELQVAQFVAKGLPNRRIASVLNLQEQSVKNLVSTIMRKLRCENRVQVALMLQNYQPLESQLMRGAEAH